MIIQWYPGHMAKTRRKMTETLKLVDLVCEIVDARIPQASRNPDLDSITGDKPRMLVLNRVDLADPDATRQWIAYYKKQGYAVMTADSKSGQGVERFGPVIEQRMAAQLAAWKEKGQSGHPIRVMVVGIPNVGKSTFINRVLGRKAAIAADKPGVTRGQQWFRLENGMELLDTPGILWPKLEDQQAGIYLAVTGAIKDNIMDIETLACKLLEILWQRRPEFLTERYRIDPEQVQADQVDFLGYELLQMAGRKRGFLMSGGEINTERMARILLDEYRGGVLGRLTLEMPPEDEK